MNSIKTIKYSGPLFRANARSFTVGQSASNNYKGAPMKYFTINKSELSAYTKYGKPYMKTWDVIHELNLIDILDISTRKALAKKIGDESLNVSFPIIRNKVSRISEENSKNKDDNVLQRICELGYDGYYMKTLKNNNNEYLFHSEVGLCPSAFTKLKLQRLNKNQVAPRIGTRKKRPINNNTRKN